MSKVGDFVGDITGTSKAMEGAKKAAQMAQFQDFGANTIFGGGTISRKSGLEYAGGPGSSLVPGFTGAATDLLAQLRNFGPVQQMNLDANQTRADATQAGNSYLPQFAGLGNEFLSGANKWAQSIAGFNPDEFASQQYERLNNLARSGEETQTQQALNTLFSRGRLGANDTAGSKLLGQLNQSQLMAQDSRALQALGLARDEASSRTGIAGQLQQSGIGAFGAGESLGSSAIQRFLQSLQGGIGVSSFQNQLQESLLQRAIGGAGGISAALQPSNQGIQNLLAASGLVNGQNAAAANTLQSGYNASAQAQGNLIGNALSMFSFGG